MFRYVLFLCLVTSFVAAQQSNPTGRSSSKPDPPALQVGTGSKSLENQLVNNEKRLANSEKTKDAAFLKSALANDLIYVAYNGWVFTKQKIVKDLQYIDINQYRMENFKVRQLGPGAALLTYDLMMHGAIAGHNLPHQLYAASVWVKKGPGWILVLHQETPAHHP